MKIGIIITILIISFSFALAHGEESFTEAENLIKQKIPCDELTYEQLEIIGDYYMEQMHPGELHEIMDERMGGEGSESLRQVHINIALSFYCGEHNSFSGNMMSIMMGRNGMMQYSYNNANSYFTIIPLFILALAIILLIILLIKLNKKSRRKK